MVTIIEIIENCLFFFKIRYLQAMKTEQDEIILVGKSFIPDIEGRRTKFIYPKKKMNQKVYWNHTSIIKVHFSQYDMEVLH